MQKRDVFRIQILLTGFGKSYFLIAAVSTENQTCGNKDVLVS